MLKQGGFLPIPILIFIAVAIIGGGTTAVVVQQIAEKKAEAVEQKIAQEEERFQGMLEERSRLATSTIKLIIAFLNAQFCGRCWPDPA